MRTREPIYYKNLNNGFYLYRSVVDPDAFPASTGFGIPRAPRLPWRQRFRNLFNESILESLRTPSFWIKAFDFLVTSLNMALEHHIPKGPGTTGVIVANVFRDNHQQTIVAPRKAKVFVSATSLTTDSLRKKNEVGDSVAQAHFLSKTGFDQAHVWIVSSEPPSTVMRQGFINKAKSLFFFTERDAKKFSKETRLTQRDLQILEAKPLKFSAEQLDRPILESFAKQLKLFIGGLSEEKRGPVQRLVSQIKRNLFNIERSVNVLLKNPQEVDLERLNKTLDQLNAQLKQYFLAYTANKKIAQGTANSLLIPHMLSWLAVMAKENNSEIRLQKTEELAPPSLQATKEATQDEEESEGEQEKIEQKEDESPHSRFIK